MPQNVLPLLRYPPKPTFSCERGTAGSAAARDLPAPPPRPAADKAAPLLPARPGQALHKAPHFRPAPVPSCRPLCFPYSRWPAPPGPARAGPSRHGVWFGDGQCPDDARWRPTARPALPPARLTAAPATADAAQTPQPTTSLPPAARQPGTRWARDAAARTRARAPQRLARDARMLGRAPRLRASAQAPAKTRLETSL